MIIQLYLTQTEVIFVLYPAWELIPLLHEGLLKGDVCFYLGFLTRLETKLILA